MSFHVISCRFMSFHVVSCRFMSFHVVSCRFMSFHFKGGWVKRETTETCMMAASPQPWHGKQVSLRLGFRDRFSDLGSGSNGSGATPLNVVNGQLILLTAGKNSNNPRTVHADTSLDTLIASNLIDPGTGNRVHNSLFYDADDTIMNFDPSSDHKTQVR
jgi:hypothetical protein